MNEKFGEFKCPYCDTVFFQKKKLDGHIGGAHRRNITDSQKPVCKFCKATLIKNRNWPEWAIKQRNLICVKCKRIQNRKSYRNRMDKKAEKYKKNVTSLKERIRNARATNHSVKTGSTLSK